MSYRDAHGTFTFQKRKNHCNFEKIKKIRRGHPGAIWVRRGPFESVGGASRASRAIPVPGSFVCPVLYLNNIFKMSKLNS
jgi:hypothetical protein